MSDLLTIGVRSLLAFQSAMTTVGQNIANASTPFYSRREIDLAEAMFNNGVNVADVRRIYDQSASSNLANTNSELGKNDLLVTQLTQLENLLDSSQNSISSYINSSLKALEDLNGNPSLAAARNMYLSMLSNMAGRFNEVNTQIQLQVSNTNQSIESVVNQANAISSQIVDLNKQLLDNDSSTNVDSLLDQRELLVQELAGYFNFTQYVDANGQLSINLENGIQLLSGVHVNTLQTVPNEEDPQYLSIELNNNGMVTDVTSNFSGGQIGALYQFQQDTLAETQRALNLLGLTITDLLNKQNKLGIDANGNLGGDIFNDVNSATAVLQRSIPNLNNTGTESISVKIDNSPDLLPSDYELEFDTATHYVLTRKSDNTVVSSGAVGTLPMNVSADGFTVTVSAASVTAGDSFLIVPTRDGAVNASITMTDPSLLAVGLPVSVSTKFQNQGTGKITLDSVLDTTNAAFSIPKQLNPPIRIEFITDTTYQIVNSNDDSVIEGPLTYDPATGADVFPTPGGVDPGYRVSLEGQIKAGDQFNINYNSNGSGDNRNGLIMAGLYNETILNGGTYTFSQYYNAFSMDVSVANNAAGMSLINSQAVQQQASYNYALISGVDSQEEMMNLWEYQQSYQASAQVLDAARTVFDVILGIAGGA